MNIDSISTARYEAFAPVRFVSNSVSIGDILKPSTSGGQVVLPVDQSLPFANFKYVSGVPSAQPGTGYSISKLQALDVLIDHLVSMRQEKLIPQMSESALGMSDGALDAMIQDLGQKISISMEAGIQGLQEQKGIDMGTATSHKGLILNTVA